MANQRRLWSDPKVRAERLGRAEAKLGRKMEMEEPMTKYSRALVEAERVRIRKAIAPHLRTLRSLPCSEESPFKNCRRCQVVAGIDAATRSRAKGKP